MIFVLRLKFYNAAHCIPFSGVVPASLVAVTSSSKPYVQQSTAVPAAPLSTQSAAQIYEILENRDAQLRKSETYCIIRIEGAKVVAIKILRCSIAMAIFLLAKHFFLRLGI